MKESDEYEFKFKTFKVESKEAKASDIFEKLYSNDEYCFLYESLETSGKIGRYPYSIQYHRQTFGPKQLYGAI